MSHNIFNYIHFSLIIQSLVVLVELLVNCKRPGILKWSLVLVALTILWQNTGILFFFENNYNRWLMELPPPILVASMLVFFSLLYQFEVRRYIIAFSVAMILTQFLVLLYLDVVANIPDNISARDIEVGKGFRFFLRAGFLSVTAVIVINILKKILGKYRSTNLYHERLKKWSGYLCLNIVFFLLVSILRDTDGWLFAFGRLLLGLGMISTLLTILFRPRFLNHSNLKFSLGDFFNNNNQRNVSSHMFLELFFQNQYYLNPNASVENLSKEMKLSAEDLYRFVYHNYHLSFNDLVNKHRVEYFIDLVRTRKFSTYTVDGLAQLSGFTSRHHLYKPFKKFHGGTPSDFIRSVVA